MLAIYKNVVILIATLVFVAQGKQAIILGLLIALLYGAVWSLLRVVECHVVQHYYDFKYAFVRVLEESIQGAQTFRIFHVESEFIAVAK